MTTELRPELGLLPERMRRLPVHRGYPVPWFVPFLDGEPEFRAADAQRWTDAISKSLCWVCGERTGRWLTFVLGPMCGITRTTAEPPCHHECAVWSAKNCPFLSKPQMVRRQPEQLKAMGGIQTGMMIERNPGVTLLWITRDYSIFRDGNRKPLIRVGDPSKVEFLKEGRTATRDEIEESIQSGLPILLAATGDDKREQVELATLTDRFRAFLPK